MYELPHEMPNDIKPKILGNEENLRKSPNVWSEGMDSLVSSLPSKTKKMAKVLENCEEEVLAQLDKLHFKDKTQYVYQVHEVLVKFKVPSEMTILTSVVDFKQFYDKARVYDVVLPDAILACKQC